jgi:C1A family cysteine protease
MEIHHRNDQRMGWLRDYPDWRDYTRTIPEVRSLYDKTGILKSDDTTRPVSVDLREWCSPVRDQGSLGACTAHAGAGMIEYLEKRLHGRHIDASRLFLYKAARNMVHLSGDSGCYLRTTMGALSLFGIPPEEYWPYEVEGFDAEPSSFCYAFARNYQALKYVRLDPPDLDKASLAGQIKAGLLAGLPSAFGFSVYMSVSQAGKDGKIPLPLPGERLRGCHAAMAIGYDDRMAIRNDGGDTTTTGAFLIRNSWGADWGEAGYGWLPYEYVNKGLTADWWELIDAEWVDTGEFGV